VRSTPHPRARRYRGRVANHDDAGADDTGTTSEPLTRDGVVGVLHRPADEPIATAVLTHGAGGNHDGLLLRQLGVALSARGVLVARIDLPYRQKRPKGPPSPSGSARDREGIVLACALMRELGAGPLVVGGHSYGGRQASMVVAEDAAVADGLLLTSYPLHPPGKPDRLRVEHLPRITRPVVVVHGPSDPFATTAELAAAVALIPAPTTVVEITGTGHDLRPDRKPTAELTIEAVLTHLRGRGTD